jgi:outer membrane receptor protein involved in Fe transport
MRRDQPQIRTSDQVVAGDPNTFVFYTLNAPRGRNYGAETSWRWRAAPQLELSGSVGLLHTMLELPIDNGATLTRRAQAHAPRYQFGFGASWQHPSGWFARTDVTGQDAFYFDVPPNETRSHAYALTHLRLGYEHEHWSISAWVRNAFDRTYATRGFYFGNEPPDFAGKLYIQPGDPRQAGVTFNLNY